MKKIIAILIAMLTMISIAIAEEDLPITGHESDGCEVEGWTNEGYDYAYYNHLNGARTDYHSHNEKAENITVTGTVQTDNVKNTYVWSYCSICNKNVKARHNHNWITKIVPGIIWNGYLKGHRIVTCCYCDYCNKQKSQFEEHDNEILTWCDDDGWHYRCTCKICDECEKDDCNHKDQTYSWYEEDCFGAWYCDYCGTRIGEFVYVGPSVPSPYNFDRLYIPMIVINNPNTLLPGSFTATEYCFVAPWSKYVIKKNNITTFDGLKYFQTNEYGTVIYELLDSKTGAVVFIHSENLIIIGEEE